MGAFLDRAQRLGIRRVWRILPARFRRSVWRGLRHLMGLYGMWRIRPGVTRVLGPQYIRSRDLLEIDITYACNLRCFNCSRSCEQAPGADHLTIGQVQRFIAESVAKDVKWRRIRLLGGEPTIHPQFLDIVALLRDWRVRHSPRTELEVCTNGHGARVRSVLSQLPRDVRIRNTQKVSPIQPDFVSFNVAPVDVPEYAHADFSHGCGIIQNCGMGLTPFGYYPCAPAGGIDRIFGLNIGRMRMPDPDDDMQDDLRRLCKLCGIFKRAQRDGSLHGPVMSPTWEAAYRAWRKNPPAVQRLPSADPEPPVRRSALEARHTR